MGKTFEKKGPRTERPDRPLSAKPMAGAFKGMRVGPECLECKGPIDSREAYSLPSPRGSRKSQRHGYLHPDCELAAMKKVSDRVGQPIQTVSKVPGPKGEQVFVTIQPGVNMEFPIYSEEEIAEILKSKGVGA